MSHQVADHGYCGERDRGAFASCQYVYPDARGGMCGRMEGEHGPIPTVQPGLPSGQRLADVTLSNTPPVRCTYGGDCPVHPDARGIHNRDVTAVEALRAVLSAVQIRPKFDADDVRQIAASLGVDLGR